jgi:hypothetical protein
LRVPRRIIHYPRYSVLSANSRQYRATRSSLALISKSGAALASLQAIGPFATLSFGHANHPLRCRDYAHSVRHASAIPPGGGHGNVSMEQHLEMWATFGEATAILCG